MNEMDITHAFKSMLMVAREYKLEIDKRYEELENELLENYDLDVTGMMDSMENIYQLFNK
ncbi:hypothetical protein P9D34_05940 [Bacillus swezeyi]|uniref:Uncharacterized protein n=1 Tax=Bacillus swezeyi TaxID=1925020 RepID=A0A1R1Q6Z3_9BACI|nr:hypothetical protein [Bacillus swezeyi]MEC1259994.1 hypothetical protein [Bacillus swezeyi]MED2929774.1 hypothetical protein [Bacillus swezeyi]MED2963199.1 hypothetical protein [Bacillus swezeyi]MED2979758.1 hypothetical protein [Bacillus swezeyi]MED3073150.1 hypothetical protein [Bacillus swezeyi]